MDPSRKRKIRLAVALCAALLLAGALLYTSFDTATQAKSPSQVLAAGGGASYKLTGKVVPGSIQHEGATLRFSVRDRAGARSLPISYQGVVPDPFRAGREVMVTGSLQRGVFVARRDSLITKCPSKFKNKPGGNTL